MDNTYGKKHDFSFGGEGHYFNSHSFFEIGLLTKMPIWNFWMFKFKKVTTHLYG
jgi:hypothetical protein